jgi:hypothetical protein
VTPEVVVEAALIVAVVKLQVNGPLLVAVTFAGAVIFCVTIVVPVAVHPLGP